MREHDWWEERVLSGLASYWVYQHLGNLSPAALDRSDLYQRVRGSDDAYRELRQFAHQPRRFTDEQALQRGSAIDQTEPDIAHEGCDTIWRCLAEQELYF